MMAIFYGVFVLIRSMLEVMMFWIVVTIRMMLWNVLTIRVMLM